MGWDVQTLERAVGWNNWLNWVWFVKSNSGWIKILRLVLKWEKRRIWWFTEENLKAC